MLLHLLIDLLVAVTTFCKIGVGCVHTCHVTSPGFEWHTLAVTGLQHLAIATHCLQVVITAVWAASTVVISTFGYSTLRTGAHMADTGTEHNIELIAQVGALHAVSLQGAVDTLQSCVQLPDPLGVAKQARR